MVVKLCSWFPWTHAPQIASKISSLFSRDNSSVLRGFFDKMMFCAFRIIGNSIRKSGLELAHCEPKLFASFQTSTIYLQPCSLLFSVLSLFSAILFTDLWWNCYKYYSGFFDRYLHVFSFMNQVCELLVIGNICWSVRQFIDLPVSWDRCLRYCRASALQS